MTVSPTAKAQRHWEPRGLPNGPVLLADDEGCERVIAGQVLLASKVTRRQRRLLRSRGKTLIQN